ncbi:MAG: hypothetical protein JNM50_02605 [Chromatiales bacterium]|nr:hypothetical protein [Chromatiales bacterium]
MENARYSLIIGGPFHALMRWLGLVDPAGLPRVAATVWLVLLAFGLPAVLVPLQSLLDPSFDGSDFWRDPRVYARWIVAIAAMLLYERVTDRIFGNLIASFGEAGMVGAESSTRFNAALARADARTSSALAEGLMVALVLLASVSSLEVRWATPQGSWAGQGTGADLDMSWAGLAVTFVGDPLFLFLLCRWIWRFLVLGWLLADIARLPLRLHAAHPDGLAGLGFLGGYPIAFLGLFFALSCVLATGIQHYLQSTPVQSYVVVAAAVVWTGLIMFLAAAPTLVFVPVLAAVRTEARRSFGHLAVRHHDEFRRRWLEGGHAGNDSPMGAPDMSSLADLNAVAASALSVGLVPIDRMTVVATLASAAVPLLPVLPIGIPVTELVPKLIGFVL